METDEQVVAQSVGGSPAAFRELYKRHGAAVHGYLARRAGRHDADDLLSEVWLRAFRARATFRANGSGALPWLYGIARNVLREQWRRGARPPTAGVLDVVDPWPDTDDRLDAASRVKALRAVVAALSTEEREALLLVVWEELTPAEVAATLGIPPGTARSRLHRALRALRATTGVQPTVSACARAKEDGPWTS